MEHADLDIRDLSVRCGVCLNYQILVGFAKRDTWHVYTYECDSQTCDVDGSRTLLEVPAELDVFSRRHPDCGGGA